uniref:Glutaredoxin n=1 Tax=viral metagenome TaxID=1070528 RepID=A0A6M3JHQ5_9ZZZZ
MILITGNTCGKCEHLLARLKKENLLDRVVVHDYDDLKETIEGLEFLCRNELIERHLPVLVCGDEIVEHEATIVKKIKEANDERN